ncbi:MAG: class I SAM-dependent methyltransferase [Sandaracinaceae bacterium]|nr:class I SAM-dependent methyltransferase [Sandaracinaceae bacterium]
MRSTLAPSAFDPRWIVHHDAHYVVVDKPAGMASIEREPGARCSLTSRLVEHLGLSRPLAVLSRLDRETSGLVAFPLSEAAQRAMAKATEEHTLAKRYVAAVELARGARVPSGRMEDMLVERDGVVSVAAGRGGKRAVAHARSLRGRGGRALVEITLETGRTHQIRVQLAHRGAAIGGDALYGAVPAPRLLLASVAITVPHPERGALSITRPVPPLFERWVDGTLTDLEAWREALPCALLRRGELFAAADRASSEATTAFRVISESGDGVPGLAVDLYGDHLLVHLHDCALAEATILDDLEALGPRGIYLKRRPRKAQDLSKKDLEEHAPSAPVRGEPADDPLVVREHGVPFEVRLGDGMSTGLFLDQRENRRRVRERSAGKSVLNLFSYTCAFSVAAAVGGARSTLSVDASSRAIERGRASFARVGIEGAEHRFVADDVFDVLSRLAKRDERFDLIIADPPTFSTTKRSRWTSGKDWVGLVAKVLAVLAEGGAALVTSNDRRMSRGAFRAFVREGAEQAGVSLVRVVDLPEPLDFRAGPGESPYLKGLWIERR